MTTEKAARAWFEMLKEPYRSQAIKASEETVRISRIEKSYASLSEAILGDFTWEETVEGGRYWDEIQMSIENSETTYLADDNDTTYGWVKCSDRLPEFGEVVLVYCKLYGRFLATYEFIGEFQGEKYGNWRDFNGNLGILPPIYWFKLPELPEPPQQ